MKAVVSLSGGMDSAVVLAEAISRGREVLAVTFQYTSKHNVWERQKAWELARTLNVQSRLVNIGNVLAHMKSDLLESGGPLPEGHYEEESMRRTVVPGRNTIFAAVLLGIAESEKADEVWLGVHAGDHHIYPDCRPGWVEAMGRVMREATDSWVQLLAPFLHHTKADILKRGLELKVPFRLTRTCYSDQEIACGRCGACQERLEAFRLVGEEDPLPYANREILPKGGVK